MSAFLRVILPCRTHVLTSVRAQWNYPVLKCSATCRSAPSLVHNPQGVQCLSTGARSRVHVKQPHKKGKNKSKKKKLMDAHKELLNVLETQQKVLNNGSVRTASGYSTSNANSLSNEHKMELPDKQLPVGHTTPNPDGPLLSSPFFDNDTFGEDSLLNSPLYQKHMKVVEESQHRANKKARKMKVLGTKMKTRALPEATTVNDSDIQITDIYGHSISDISQSNVYYLDSSIAEDEKQLVNEIGKIMPNGLSDELRKELSVLAARLQAKEDSQNETSQIRYANLKKMVNSLAKKPKIVPFWKPEELKNMDEVLLASQLVRFLNSELSRETSKLQHLANEKVRRAAAYNHEVKSYVEACIQADMVKTAHSYLVGQHLGHQHKTRQRSKSARNAAVAMDKQVTDPATYDLLIRAWAKQGDLASVRQLFQLMQSQGVRPSLTAYVHCLHCLGRCHANVAHITQRVIWDLRRAGYELENALHGCALHQGEKQYVLKAVHSVLPDFSPKPPPPAEPYRCELLNQLNHVGSRQPSTITNQQLDEKAVDAELSSSHTLDSNHPGALDAKSPGSVGNPNQGILGAATLRTRAVQQLRLEEDGFVEIPSIGASGTVGKTTKIFRERLSTLKEKWRGIIHKSLQRDLQELRAAMKVSGMTYTSIYPYLKLLPVDKLVDYVMQEADDLAMEMQRHSPSLTLLQCFLGYRIQRQSLVLDRRKTGYTEKMLEVYEGYLEAYSAPTLDGRNHRQMWQELADKHWDGTSLDGKFVAWPRHIASQVGKLLYTIILMDLKIPVNLLKQQPGTEEFPAFYTLNQKNELNQDVMVIRPHPDLARLFEESQITDMRFTSSDMPSLVPPPPWCSLHKGGTFLATVGLVKHKPQYLQQLERLPDVQLYPVLDGLNSVSSVPWIINKPVLDLVIELFNRGGDPRLDVPRPASALPLPPEITSNMTPKQRQQCLKKRQHVNKERKETHSLWMTELYRLSIANKYRDEVFWFPHNLDFRGRSYAIPPHFNHLGADLARSILVFAKGRPLGVDGLKWLKIHLVNLTGMKKRSSNEDRLAFADEMMPEILDSADNPFTGNKWWQSSDEAWQTLACCMEIAAAKRSGDATTFVSHFPVHQDGSCNGLQHYAALGRDQAGAESVNLYPFSAPKDVYSDVVELVEEERIHDAAADVDVAKALEGFICRKVIKQTIMTTVYGVTPYGARLQIRGQLKNMDDFPQERLPEATKYLSEKTFKCLEKMFTRTKEIQDWLTISAELASTISNKPVAWETPLGLPVIQPYFKQFRETLGNPGGGKPSVFYYEKPSMMKQRNGFPPNFIHSLDGTHMMLTAIYCLLEGVTFVSVHDCFWTHAADVPKMNQICREQFVALHSQPILEGLALGMLEKYGFTHSDPDCAVDPITQDFMNHVLSTVPKRGSFELNKVLESTYFFS